jgi:hypothetical protein
MYVCVHDTYSTCPPISLSLIIFQEVSKALGQTRSEVNARTACIVRIQELAASARCDGYKNRLARRVMGLWAEYNKYLQVNTRASYLFCIHRHRVSLQRAVAIWCSRLERANNQQMVISGIRRAVAHWYRMMLLREGWNRLSASAVMNLNMESVGRAMLYLTQKRKLFAVLLGWAHFVVFKAQRDESLLRLAARCVRQAASRALRRWMRSAHEAACLWQSEEHIRCLYVVFLREG